MTQDRAPLTTRNTNGSAASMDAASSFAETPGAAASSETSIVRMLGNLWSPTEKPGLLRDIFGLILSLAVAFLFLRPVLDTGFINDDFNAIHLSVVGFDREHFTTKELWHQIAITFRLKATPHLTIHRPLVMLTFLANVIRSGTDPSAFAKTTLAIHLLAGIVFFGLTRTFWPRAGTAAVACGTLLFLLTPLNLEAASWSSARSDTLSFIFGALALIVRRRRTDSTSAAVVAALLVLVALLAKESALAFLLALGIFDLETAWRRRTSAGGGLVGFAVEALWRALPILIVFCLFATIRYFVFDTVFGHYTSKTGAALLSRQSLSENLRQSLAVLVAPVSSIAFPSLIARGPLISLSVVAVAAILIFAAIRIRRADASSMVVIASVFGASLVLSVLANSATFALVGTRALYTPFAMFAVAAVGVSSRIGRPSLEFLPLTILFLLAAFTVRPSIDPHIVTSKRIAATVGSIHDAVRPIDDGKSRTIMILGYEEERFFSGSYDMAIGLTKSVRTPFLRHDYDLFKVSGPAGAIGDVRAFDDALGRIDPDRTIVFEMGILPEGRRAKLVWPGRRDAADGSAVVPKSPNALEEVVVDLSDDRSPPPTLVFHPGATPAHAYALTVMTPFLAVTGLVLDAKETAAAGPGQGLHAIVVPKAAIEASSPDSTQGVFAWAVTALDRNGQPLARSGLAFFRGRVIHKK